MTWVVVFNNKKKFLKNFRQSEIFLKKMLDM